MKHSEKQENTNLPTDAQLEPKVEGRRLGDRLAAARRNHFVGRIEELEAFARMLRPNPDFSLLFIHGPGGMGKSSLLSEFARVCLDQHWTPLLLDARNIDPSPDGFLQALAGVMRLESNVSPLLALEQGALEGLHGGVLMLDTFENLKPLDAWLRERFLPELPEAMRVVLAGREPPNPQWSGDSGWRELMRVQGLRNLRPEESRDLLHKRGLPHTAQDALLAFTHGHPLALSLVAETFRSQAANPSLEFDPDQHPDMLRTLLERFVQSVPSPAHRAALEICALVHTTTESVLAAGLDAPEVHELFAWLRSLSFVQEGPNGLSPHELLRDVIHRDLRWRNPDWNALLHRRVRHYYTKRLLEARGSEQQRVLLEDVYLHRLNPMVKPFLTWGEFGAAYSEPLKVANVVDQQGVLKLITDFEGEQERKTALHWLERFPQGFTVYRDAQGSLSGVLVKLELSQISPEDLERDPFTRSLGDWLARQGSLQEGETALLFRYWLSRDEGQGVSSVQSLIFIQAVQAYISTPKMAWSFFAVSDFEFWQPAFSYMGCRAVALEGGGAQRGAYARDWRSGGIPAWLEMLGERELLTESLPLEETPLSERILMLSQPEFEAAVRMALKDFTRPHALAKNPLMHSRLLGGANPENSNQSNNQPNSTQLRKLIWNTAQELKLNAREVKLYRALERTYLEPADTQELAAELLELPFSTYRRHLTQGIECLVERLWALELGRG